MATAPTCEQLLANTIIIQAADDYRQAWLGYKVDGHAPKDVMNETERFFKGDLCEVLSSFDCTKLPQMIQKDELQKAIDLYSLIIQGHPFEIRIRVKKDKGVYANYRVPPRLKDAYEILCYEERERLHRQLEELKDV